MPPLCELNDEMIINNEAYDLAKLKMAGSVLAQAISDEIASAISKLANQQAAISNESIKFIAKQVASFFPLLEKSGTNWPIQANIGPA